MPPAGQTYKGTSTRLHYQGFSSSFQNQKYDYKPKTWSAKAVAIRADIFMSLVDFKYSDSVAPDEFSQAYGESNDNFKSVLFVN